MCAALGVSVAGFHGAGCRTAAPPPGRARTDARLRVEVRAAHAKRHRRYGAPRVHRERRTARVGVAKKRVARLLREDGLVARRAGRWVRTTDRAHAHPVAPNVVARGFAVAVQSELARTWVSHFTDVATGTPLAWRGFVSVAFGIDVFSRRRVGWRAHTAMRTAMLVLRASSGGARPR